MLSSSNTTTIELCKILKDAGQNTFNNIPLLTLKYLCCNFSAIYRKEKVILAYTLQGIIRNS